MTPFADLHCHSLFSDGTLSPREIACKAVEKAFRGVTITDHDNFEGSRIVEPIAKEMGLEFFYGIEFSSYFEEESIHILGYRFHPDAPSIVALCQKHERRRDLRNEAICQKLRDYGFDIDLDRIRSKTSGIIGRPHIAKELVEIQASSSIQEAFSLWLGDGKKAFIREETPTVSDTLEAIHKGGGVAILAHPHFIKNRPRLFRLLELPFDGIEAWYGSFRQAKSFLNIAKERNWIVTGGSDFHGDIKPHSSYGSSTTDETNFRRIQNFAR